MEMSFFIVIDANVNLRSIRINSEEYEYTNTGTKIYPFNSPLPVIRKGSGCIGIAIVKNINLTGTSTTVTFTFTEVDQDSAKAYYSLYRNTTSMNTMSSDDAYENAEDAVIPGAMLNAQKMKNVGDKRYSGSKSRGTNLYEEAGLSYEPRRKGHSSFGSRFNRDFDDD